MEKAEIKLRIDSLREGAEKDREKNNYKAKKNPVEKKAEEKPKKKFVGKVCPFSLASGKARQCGNWCQLHRDRDSKFACPLQEISTISWNTRKNTQR